MSSFASGEGAPYEALPQRKNSRRKRWRSAEVDGTSSAIVESSLFTSRKDSYLGKAIVVDGSMGEGGGQIIRNAMTLSCLFKHTLSINNIRAGRKVPGLRQQHLTGAILSARLAGGQLGANAKVQSNELSFIPPSGKGSRKVGANKIVADCKTAGSVTLLLQTCLPLLYFSSDAVAVELVGGTSVAFSPPYIFFEKVLLPVLNMHFKASILVKLVKEGFFPRGGGRVLLQTGGGSGKTMCPIDLVERGPLEKVDCYVKFIGDEWGRQQGAQSIKSQEQAVEDIVNKTIGTFFPGSTAIEYYVSRSEVSKGKKGPSTGVEIQLVASTKNKCLLSGNALVYRKSASGLGAEAAVVAANNLAMELKSSACVSEHLADQLIIFMALAKGTSRIRIRPTSTFSSKHLETGIYIIKELVNKAQVRVYPNPKDNGESEIVECQGIGFT